MRLLLLAVSMLVSCTGSDTSTDTDTADSSIPDSGDDSDTDPQDSDTDPAVLEGTLVLPEVTVVDAEGRRASVWVVVDGDTIVAVEEATPTVPGARVVEAARGRFVTPGLVDPHVHLFLSGASGATGEVHFTLRDALRANLASGVTSVFDLGAPDTIGELLPLARDPAWRGPSVRATGPFLTVPTAHPCEAAPGATCTFVSTPAEVDAALAARADAGLHGLKLAFTDASHTPWETPRLDPALAARVLASDLAVRAVHADAESEALQALDLGATHLGHPPFAAPISTEGASGVASDAVAVHTTLSAFAGVGDVLADRLSWEALDGLTPPEVLADWRAVRDEPGLLVPGYAAESEGWAGAARASVVRLHAAGATVLPASDAGYLFVPHGTGLHRELAALEAAGLSRSDLLRASTLDAARASGWEDRGLVTAGQRADLLVLDGDPLADLSVLRTPELVVLGGEPVSRAELLSPGWQPLPGERALCLGDCGLGRVCDPSTQRCEDIACDVAFQVDDPCGSDAFCAPTRSCRSARTCDLLDPAGTCAPAAYGQNCVPYDRDTSVCVPSGPRSAGEACDVRFQGTSCVQGSVCSPITSTCFALCDPAGGEPRCGAGESCVVQEVFGAPWYALCLAD